MNVAASCEKAPHARVIRICMMPHEWQEFCVVPLHGWQDAMSRRVADFDGSSVIVEAPQLCVELLFGKRGIAGRPVDLPIGIANQMKRRAPEQVTSRAFCVHACGRQPELSKVARERGELARPARRERQTAPVEDRPSNDLAARGDEPGVVLVAEASVCLLRQICLGRDGVGTHDLHEGGTAHEGECGDSQRTPEHVHRRRKRRAWRTHPPRDRRTHADGGEVAEHGGASVAQERRHDTGKRKHPEHATHDHDRLRRETKCESGGEEKRVVAGRAERDPQHAPD
jgi:hypothetical protein